MRDAVPPAKTLRIGTRGSRLARWQANWVAAECARHGQAATLVEISTRGDQSQSGPIGAIGAVGVFTKEIQRALLQGDVDLAVHSLKDLPSTMTDGLLLAAVPPREHVADALVANRADSLDGLPLGARIGTGSIRRRAQLLHLRPDLNVAGIRGNVDTRLRRLDDGDYDAILLAAAGLRRLGWEERITQLLSGDIMVPAVGQGALGIECRTDDLTTQHAIAPLNHAATHQAVRAERALLAALRGGCSAPIGAWGRSDPDGQLRLSAVVLSQDGQHRIAEEDVAAPATATELGQRVADRLIAQGATELLDGHA